MVRPGRRVVLLMAALLAAGAAAAALALVWLPRDEAPPVLASDLIAVRASLTPQTHLFGDPLSARVDVLVDRAFVDPSTVQVDPSFRPYRRSGRVTRTQTDVGLTSRAVFDFPLSCLERRCLARQGRRRIELPQADVTYVLKDLGRQVTRVEWPLVETAARVGEAALVSPQLRADPRDLPEPTYRLEPRRVAAGGIALAAIGLGAAVALLAPLVPFAALARRLRLLRAGRLSSLEQALAHVRETNVEGPRDERRRALDRLASELQRAERETLALSAGELAWSKPEPSRHGVGDLSDDVERSLEEAS